MDFGTPQRRSPKDDQYVATAEQADLSAMMQKIDNVASGVENLTKSFTGFKIDTLVGPLRDFITANKDPLTVTISNVQALSFDISSQVSQGKGTLGKLIKDESLYNTALSTVSNLQDTATEIKVHCRRRPQNRGPGQLRPGHRRQAGEGRQALPRDHRVHDER